MPMVRRSYLVAFALTAFACGPALTAETTRISVSSSAKQANGDSEKSSISFDGRYVAFSSQATNLVPDDTNNAYDVFVHDNDTDETVRVSLGPDGVEAKGASYRPAISGDGRFVAFTSTANNLVEGDRNGKADIFVFDRRTKKIERVSVTSGGDEANGASDFVSISADGQRVVFQTMATNLFPADDNAYSDVLLRDRTAAITTLVSRNTEGEPGNHFSDRPMISADGSFVTFRTGSTNIGKHRVTAEGSNIVRHDLKSGATICVITLRDFCQDTLADLPASAISANGRYVVFQDFVDGKTGTVEPLVIANILRDMDTGDQTIVTRPPSGDFANYDSYAPAISSDGRLVAYSSGASNLVNGDTNKKLDVFVTDRLTGAVTRASLGGTARQTSLNSSYAAISGDGRVVTFSSQSSELVDGDSNNAVDIFMRDLEAEPGKKADIRIEARLAPRKVRRGEGTSFSFVATNAGPDLANKASFSMHVENGRVKTASSKQGHCRASAGLVTCDLGKLGPQQSIVVKAEIIAEGGPLRQTVRVYAAPLDPAKADNSLTVNSKVVAN